MKSIAILVVANFIFITAARSQKIYATRNGQISFVATKDDDVSAVNNEVTSRIFSNGQMTFSLLIKGFNFKYAEMQDHFNADYLESNKFPRADFKGNIINGKDVNFTKNGTYKVNVKGSLTLHGVTQEVTTTGTIEIKDGKLTARCSFTVVMKDYKIEASDVTDKVVVKVNCQYQ